MGQIQRGFLAIVGAAATALSVHAQQQPQQYIVDWVMTGAPFPMTMHVSKDGPRQRIDMDMPVMAPMAMQFYTCPKSIIVRPDLSKVFDLTHYKKQYTERAFDPKLDGMDLRNEGTVEEMGTEAVEGESCLKYKITTDDGAFYLWMSEETNMMRKMAQAGGQGFGLDARNVQLVAPGAGTFDVPPDYTQISMTGQATKGLMAGIMGGVMSSFLPGPLGGAAGMMQARQNMARMQEDAAAIQKNCKPGKLPGM